MSQIKELTEEQKAIIPKWRDEWFDIGCDTAPADRKTAEEAFAALYELVGEKAPPVIWCGSPLTAMFMLNMLDNGLGEEISRRFQVLSATPESLECFPWDLYQVVTRPLRMSVWYNLRPAIHNGLGKELSESIPGVRASLREALRTESDRQQKPPWLYDVIGSPLWESIQNGLLFRISNDLRDAMGEGMAKSFYEGPFIEQPWSQRLHDLYGDVASPILDSVWNGLNVPVLNAVRNVVLDRPGFEMHRVAARPNMMNSTLFLGLAPIRVATTHALARSAIIALTSQALDQALHNPGEGLAGMMDLDYASTAARTPRFLRRGIFGLSAIVGLRDSTAGDLGDNLRGAMDPLFNMGSRALDEHDVLGAFAQVRPGIDALYYPIRYAVLQMRGVGRPVDAVKMSGPSLHKFTSQANLGATAGAYSDICSSLFNSLCLSLARNIDDALAGSFDGIQPSTGIFYRISSVETGLIGRHSLYNRTFVEPSINADHARDMADYLGRTLAASLNRAIGETLCRTLNALAPGLGLDLGGAIDAHASEDGHLGSAAMEPLHYTSLNNNPARQMWRYLYDTIHASLGVPVTFACSRIPRELGDSKLYNHAFDGRDGLLRQAIPPLGGMTHRACVSTWDIYGPLLDTIAHSLGSAINTALNRALEKGLKNYSCWFSGQMDAHWLAFYSFCDYIGVEYKEETKAKLDELCKIARSCGWWWPYENVIVACERPLEVHWNDDERPRIHNDRGPAVLFRDGWAIHALNGVRVPAEVACLPPDEIDPLVVIKEPSTDVRREIVGKIGYNRLVEGLGGETIDVGSVLTAEGIFHEYELIVVDLKDSRRRPFLKVPDASDPDKFYFEGVPPHVRTVEAAMEWRGQGMDPLWAR